MVNAQTASAGSAGSGSGQPANVADLVHEAAAGEPGHPALVQITDGARMTWAELDAAVDRQAVALAGAGVVAGDRVLVRLPTSIDFCVAVFGVLRLGATVVLVGPGLVARELDGVLASSGAAAMLATGADPVAADAAARAGTRLLAPDRPAGSAPSAGSPPPPAVTRGGEDPAVIVYTSGTDGEPRGAVLSHRALLANARQCAALRPAPVTPADQVLLALPLFHVYGLGPGLLQVALAGATAVLADRFDARECLDALARYRVTSVVGVPPMYRAWLALGTDEVRRGFATVRLLTSGAAPLAPDLLAAVTAATGLPLWEGYGLTETGPVLTSTLVGGTPMPRSVGRALPGDPDGPCPVGPVELRLVDATGAPLAGIPEVDEDATGTGLVCARGPNLFSGYWAGPDTAPVDGPDEEGWFRTGDVGYFDPDGELYLVERLGDLIIVNGFNVYPHEVERVLAEHPGVSEAAVVGVPDAATGEAVRAVVVPVPGAAVTEEELGAHCAARLARFKRPTAIRIADSLPHTSTGKLTRRLLREAVTLPG